MNFRHAVFSIHGAVAALLATVFITWTFVEDLPFGRADGFSTAFLLWTGWLAFAIYTFLFLYALRKNAHRFGYSPEFRREVPLETLKDAHRRFSEIRSRIRLRKIDTAADIKAAAVQALNDAGAARVLKPVVEEGGGPDEAFRLHAVPREPLLRLSDWFQGHVNYGLAAALLVWFHGGLNFSSPMGAALNALSLLVLGTGFLGLWLWSSGPKRLTARERDLSLEKAYALRDHYTRKVADERRKLEQEPERASFMNRIERAAPGAGSMAPVLDQVPDKDRGALNDFAVLTSQRANVEAEWRALNRIRSNMHSWRAIHVPCSIALMVMVAVHVASVLYY